MEVELRLTAVVGEGLSVQESKEKIVSNTESKKNESRFHEIRILLPLHALCKQKNK